MTYAGLYYLAVEENGPVVIAAENPWPTSHLRPSKTWLFLIPNQINNDRKKKNQHSWKF